MSFKLIQFFCDPFKWSQKKDINLVDYLNQNRKHITINQLLIMSLYVAKILDFLSKGKIVHGLIRCSSFCVSENGLIRLRQEPSRKMDKIRDRFWLSPEHFNNQGDNPTIAGDVFAFGTTLWEIFSFGRKPNGFVNQLLCPSPCPSSIWKLIQRCWSENPSDRPKPVELYNYILEIESNYNKLTGQVKENVDCHHTDPSSWLIPFEQLQPVTRNGKLETLGQGVYGQVFKAYYPRDSTNCVAVKRFKYQGKTVNQMDSDFHREFKIMTKISHPNVIEIIGIVTEPEVMLVMEFAKLGSLETFLRKLTPDHFKFVPFLKFTQDIASGMEYLEKNQIVHRDLASRNILMTSLSTLKIADFGLSQSLAPGESVYVVKTERPIPALWYAPESIDINPIFTHKSDVWSFGVTLWEIFMLGSHPNYPVIDVQNLINLLITGKRLTIPDKNVPFTNECWPIIVNCWNLNPIDRPNFTQLRQQIQQISSFSLLYNQ